MSVDNRSKMQNDGSFEFSNVSRDVSFFVVSFARQRCATGNDGTGVCSTSKRMYTLDIEGHAERARDGRCTRQINYVKGEHVLI